MGDRRCGAQLPQDRETQILARIVDAMFAAQTELCDATPDQWSRTLIDACRRQKRRSALYAAPRSRC